MNFFRRFQQFVPQIFVAISSLIAVRFHLTMNSSTSPRGKLGGESTASDGSVVATRKLLSGVSLSNNKGKTEVISNSYHDAEERLERARKANEMNGKSSEEEKEEEKVQVEINDSFRQLDNVSEPTVELGKPVKNNWCFLGPLMLLSIILIALGVGYVLNSSSESEDNPDEDLFLQGPEAPWLLTPTAVPGIDPTTNNEDDVFSPNPSPTILSASTPTDSSPSPPPVLYNWVFDLPVYSKDALKIPNSPQNKAVDWMLVLPAEIISSMQPWQTKQLFALTTFYFSMNGPDWPQDMDDWLNNYNNIGDECNWSFSPDPTGQLSQPCNLSTGRYRALLLHELELAAHRPILLKELALLSELESIQLAGNEIYAPLDDMVPLRLFRLEYLTHIDLSNNLLYGTIPLDLSWFAALQTLRLQNNRLEGPIPSSLGETLSDLKELNLSYNSLTGTIPSELGLMTSLTLLDLSYNNIDFWTYGVPDELLALTDLKIVL